MSLNIVITLILSTILYGCGSEDKAQAPQGEAPSVKDTSEKTRQDSLYLETKDDLPECTADNDRQLVYIVESESFMSCSKEEWVDVVIKGSEAAKDGRDGKDGVNGKDAPYVGPGEWIEPASGRKVFLGITFSRGSVPSCAAGSSFPTAEFVKEAIKSGLFAKFGINQYVTNGSSEYYLWVGVNQVIHRGPGGQTGEFISLQAPHNGNLSHQTLCVKD